MAALAGTEQHPVPGGARALPRGPWGQCDAFVSLMEPGATLDCLNSNLCCVTLDGVSYPSVPQFFLYTNGANSGPEFKGWL